MLRLRELRLENEKTQEEMAKILGVSRQVYANHENGINEPSLEMLIRMANFFQCSVDFLIGNSDDFGNISVYRTENSSALSGNEQKIIDAIRENAPFNPVEWVSLYASLPAYMQESIFAELKGMHLGYTTAKSKTYKGV